MKSKIRVKVTEPSVMLDTDIKFSRVSAWYGNTTGHGTLEFFQPLIQELVIEHFLKTLKV